MGRERGFFDGKGRVQWTNRVSQGLGSEVTVGQTSKRLCRVGFWRRR